MICLSTVPASLKNICHWVDDNPEKLPCIFPIPFVCSLIWVPHWDGHRNVLPRFCFMSGLAAQLWEVWSAASSSCHMFQGLPVPVEWSHTLSQGSLTPMSKWGSYCSVTKSCLTLCDPHGPQHSRLLCPPLSPGVCSNSCPLSQRCYLTISSSTVPFSFYLQSFPASGSYPMSWLFASGGQSVGASASASALPMNIQGWFPLGLTGLISLQSRRLSRVFSSTTIWKDIFSGTQHSLWFNSRIHTWWWEGGEV